MLTSIDQMQEIMTSKIIEVKVSDKIETITSDQDLQEIKDKMETLETIDNKVISNQEIQIKVLIILESLWLEKKK